jgi:hypothetical protein
LYLYLEPKTDGPESSELCLIYVQCKVMGSPDPRAEALQLCVVSAPFVEEHEWAETDTQGVGRLEGGYVTRGDRRHR